jgi:hypothetical protein
VPAATPARDCDPTAAAVSQARDAGQGSPAPSTDRSGRSARPAPIAPERRDSQTIRSHTTSVDTGGEAKAPRTLRSGRAHSNGELAPHARLLIFARAREPIRGTRPRPKDVAEGKPTSVRRAAVPRGRTARSATQPPRSRPTEFAHPPRSPRFSRPRATIRPDRSSSSR